MKNKRTENHDLTKFTSSIGFILSCAGSAVGLGNMWMFPYRIGQFGGAAFLIPYLLFTFLFGWVGLSAEIAIGRMAQAGAVGAYEFCFTERKKKKLGAVISLVPLLGTLGIAIGYAIILGWVLRSLAGSITGKLFIAGGKEYFNQASGDFGSIFWHALIIVMVCFILMLGVVKGIEKISSILMPLFFLLFLMLAVWVSFLPGAAQGYRFLFIPRWEALLRADTWIMALGQAFFSLSITGSAMMCYGSYLKDDVDIVSVSLKTALLDTLAALLSAIAIMPAVFAFQMDAAHGPALIFITLPEVFNRMPMGRSFSIFFFTSVMFAGITSLMNMLETVSESLNSRFGLNRKKAVCMCAVFTLLPGIFLEAEPKVGIWMDVMTIAVIPIGAVLGAISVYYILGFKKIRHELEKGRKKGRLPEMFAIAGKYIYVPVTVLILILGFLYNGIG